jgi:GTP cyclohydrolase I
MRSKKKNGRKMPDIAAEQKVEAAAPIDKVGMSGVEIPVQLKSSGSKTFIIPARADAFVSLDQENVKGIHMSRLYLLLQEKMESEILSFSLLEEITKAFVDSHKDLSSKSYIKITFDFMTKRPALLSEKSGWRSYPVTLEASYDSKKNECNFKMGITITYSSTCPCSAALARQLISEKFLSDFTKTSTFKKSEVAEWLLKEESICATPHSQRSFAHIDLNFGSNKKNSDFLKYIELVENTLQTSVQAAVKREDEQEFALLSGKNLMFCEDAARKIKAKLDKEKSILGYRIEANHVESLHPHNAISIIEKKFT